MMVFTQTAAYALNEEEGTLIRFPQKASGEYWPSELRKDGEYIHYRLVRPLVVGEPALFMLKLRDDGVETLRTTTPVERIEEGLSWVLGTL